MESKCLRCNGKGKISEVQWVFWLRSVDCPKCKGTGRVTRTTSKTSSGSDEPSQPFFEDGIISIPSAKHQVHEESVVGHGGMFGGAGASASWGDATNQPSSCPSDSGSCGSSDSGGGGGD